MVDWFLSSGISVFPPNLRCVLTLHSGLNSKNPPKTKFWKFVKLTGYTCSCNDLINFEYASACNDRKRKFCESSEASLENILRGTYFRHFFRYLKPVCAVAHRRDNDSGKKMPSSSQRRERRLDRAVIMMMPIIAKFALVLMPPSPRLLIRVKNAFTVYLMVKRYFSQFLTS